jgi:preprotein translocase SecE subunit
MKSLTTFLLEVLEELKKIQWPDRAEFIFCVSMTLLIVILFSLFFAGVDSAIGYFIKKIIIALV